MRNSNILCIALLALVACTPKATIGGKISGLTTGDTVTVNILDVNVLTPAKKVAVAADGSFSVKLPSNAADPDMVYLSYKNVIIPNLLVFPDDNIVVTADTLGAFSVAGSPECTLLEEYHKEFSRVNTLLDNLQDEITNETNEAKKKALANEYGTILRDHYRYALKYVVSNPKSLTSIQVLNQSIGPFSDVLQRYSDAFTFKTVCDSLETVYPESRYVKALHKEADRRIKAFNLSQKLKEVQQLGFPELRLPDTNAEKISLKEISDVNKIVLLHFWRSSSATDNNFNTSILMDIYNTYHSRGLEIYAVSFDTDKALWARAVKDQKLPWINVCDGLGAASPAVGSYNVTALPRTYIIGNGEIETQVLSNEKEIRAYLDKKLK